MEYDGMDVEHDVVVILGIRMGTLFGRSTVEDRFKHGRKDQELVQSCISFLALRKKLASAVSSLTRRTF